MIVSVADLKTYLGITGTDEDVRLATWADAATAYVHTYTRRYFGAVEEVTEIYAGSGTPRLWLLETPVADGESLEEPEIDIVERLHADDTGRAIDPEDPDGYVVQGALLLRSGGTVWLREMQYSATYARGYEDGEAPADIRQAVYDMVQLKREAYRRGGKVVGSEKLGDYAYTLGDVTQAGRILGMDHMDTLNRWRRRFPVTL